VDDVDGPAAMRLLPSIGSRDGEDIEILAD
jgi:hypothetical protein